MKISKAKIEEVAKSFANERFNAVLQRSKSKEEYNDEIESLHKDISAEYHIVGKLLGIDKDNFIEEEYEEIVNEFDKIYHEEILKLDDVNT
jgi:hypothetical protein